MMATWLPGFCCVDRNSNMVGIDAMEYPFHTSMSGVGLVALMGFNPRFDSTSPLSMPLQQYRMLLLSRSNNA